MPRIRIEEANFSVEDLGQIRDEDTYNPDLAGIGEYADTRYNPDNIREDILDEKSLNISRGE